ncbi:MAG: hypothetical protein ACP5E9_02980 [Candidatus Methanospirareceae archaeon]
MQVRAILLALVVVSSISIAVAVTTAGVTELTVSPEVVVQGEQLSISGIAAPDEEVWLHSSFELDIPVADGEYFREFSGIYFPPGNKSFSTTVRNIENIRLAFYIAFMDWWFDYPIDGPLTATDGLATITISFPPGVTLDGLTIKNISGEQDVKVYGEAVDGATSVKLEFTMSIAVIADAEGQFALNLSTKGIPVGEYVISADGLQKTVQVIAPLPTIDTGSGTYPSSPGVHKGSITPSKTVNVSALYTYPCPGTGGHTEYAAFSYLNGTAIAEAYWDGYVDDWHNLTFNNPFTLYANETYNYTIRTGSYPQIIHAESKDAGDGTITCTSFTDANGKVYYDWIPALKLICTGTQ